MKGQLIGTMSWMLYVSDSNVPIDTLDAIMTPIEKFMGALFELLAGTFDTFLTMFANMDTPQLATLAICAVVVGAMCLRGTPVRGA